MDSKAKATVGPLARIAFPFVSLVRWFLDLRFVTFAVFQLVFPLRRAHLVSLLVVTLVAAGLPYLLYT